MSASDSNDLTALDLRAIDRNVEGCARSHQLLLHAVDEYLEREGPSAVSAPSSLPGWTRAHVLTHIARNAESFLVAFAAAARGEEVARYPGGVAQREGDIDDGARRTATEIVDDVRSTIYRLEGAWANADHHIWSGWTRNNAGGREQIADTVFLRWREVVAHHFDLDIGLTIDEWPSLYVRLESERQMMGWRARQPMGMGALPAAVAALDENRRVAWFLGRLTVPGTDPGVVT